MAKNKHHGIENHRYAVEMHEVRSSGKAGTHKDKRFKRARTRAASKEKAIRDF